TLPAGFFLALSKVESTVLKIELLSGGSFGTVNSERREQRRHKTNAQIPFPFPEYDAIRSWLPVRSYRVGHIVSGNLVQALLSVGVSFPFQGHPSMPQLQVAR